MGCGSLDLKRYYNYAIGLIKQSYLESKRKEYGFDPWHTTPKERKPYCLDLIRYLNKNVAPGDSIVEIGCGLGEIIKSVRKGNLYGYDTEKNVIAAAKSIDKKKRVHFSVGSFEDVQGLDLKYLITVNFIHDIDPAYLQEAYMKICRDNKVSYIVVDRVDYEGYRYIHDLSRIMPPGYVIERSFGNYLFNRKLFIFKRDESKGVSKL